MKSITAPTRCPACQEALALVELACPSCTTHVRGRFTPRPLAALAPELQEFIQVFVLARGNIREVERELGISYPTVRNRLESAIEALGRAMAQPRRAPGRNEVLEALERGELSPAEAIAQLEARSE